LTFNLNKILNYLLYILIIMTPVGILIMLNEDLKNKFIWTTSIFLTIQFLALVIYMIINFRNKLFYFLLFFLLLFAFIVEYLGIKTGFLFGNYHYSKILQPQILDVPVSIVFSWFVLSASSYFVSLKLFQSKKILTIFMSAFIILAIDFMLEPFATLINRFWIWENNIIPVTNYLGWFFIAIIFSVLLMYSLKPQKSLFGKFSLNEYTPFVLLAISLIQFTIINLINHFFIQTFLSLFLLSTIFFAGMRFSRNEI